MSRGSALPLSGVRILDLSRVLAGPWATQALADLGAEVIKIERPGTGDDTRAWGPPFLKTTSGEETGDAAYFLAANRGKKSVAINIAHPEGQRLIHALARVSHAVIENFKVGDLARHGLDAASLHRTNPALVYCSITGFGQTGPSARHAGYDAMIQARSGLMSLTGEPDDTPGGGPMKIGVALVDVMTGLYAALGLVAAIREAEQTGRGRVIDLALLDTAVACLANQAMNYLVGGAPPSRLGTAHPNIVPYQAVATADGHLMLAVGNDAQFERFCEVAGLPELPADPRFKRNRDRVAHRDTLLSLLLPVLRSRSTQTWLTALEAAGVPCGPINDLEAVFADPQVQARGLRMELAHPEAGTVPLVRSPLRFSDDAPPPSPPPRLGEHTRETLGALLTLSSNDLDKLTQLGVIA